MFKRYPLLTASIAFLALVAACANQEAPARKAVADAEAAYTAIHDDATRFAPDAASAMETSIGDLKAALAKKDYKAVLAAASGVTAQIGALRETVATKKAEYEAALAAAKDQWGAYAADLPKMVATIQSRVDMLKKSKRLPANVSREALANATSGLDSMKSTWTQASDAFAAGNALDAVKLAESVKSKGNEVLALLGMAPKS
ncbi:MAG: hypothetical protein IPI06_03155 [Gammaproteobacteria bacterium]|nr:hypothetical protein [Gammaproteobacteria bacterium]